MTIDDVEDMESILVVKIPDSKTKTSRIFTINNIDSIDYLSFYRNYIALRPKDEGTPRRLFLKYNKGKCSCQVVGMNSIAKIPSEVANYLKLPDCHLYTGHCFRRTSATLLVYGGGNITQLKRHGGWKSANVTEGYIEDCVNNKYNNEHINNEYNNEHNKDCNNENDNEYNNEYNNEIGTSKNIFSGPIAVQHIEYKTDQEFNLSNSDIPVGSKIIIKNCVNCTFNFNIVNSN